MSQNDRPYASAPNSSQKRLFSQHVTPSTADTDRSFDSEAESEPKKPKALFADNDGDTSDDKNKQSLLSISCSSDSDRDSPVPYPSQATQATQPFLHTPLSQVDDPSSPPSYFLVPADTHEPIKLSTDKTYMLGRHSDCDIVVHHPSVSNQHATLSWDPKADAFLLAPYNTCSSNPYGTAVHVWKEGRFQRCVDATWLQPNEPFRLLPACAAPHNAKNVQFTLGKHESISRRIRAGSCSFDYAYLDLLRRIQRVGVKQTNKKGDNWTLPNHHTLEIDLKCDDTTKNLVPLSTLRTIFFTSCLVEALWYLRGEDHTAFLVANGCRFWEAQARDGFIGLNYGLLTNFPGLGNQLEKEVIQPLCHGKSSRNMVCSLVSPHETLQTACTTSVQFTRDREWLNLTVNQRSSDVVLGLPNDVVVWSIILHLVRREVKRRSGIDLGAGELSFSISAGGAHVYCQNKDNFDELLLRAPMDQVQPCFLGPDVSLEHLAQHYDRYSNNFGLKVLGYGITDHHPRMVIAQAT